MHDLSPFRKSVAVEAAMLEALGSPSEYASDPINPFTGVKCGRQVWLTF